MIKQNMREVEKEEKSSKYVHGDSVATLISCHRSDKQHNHYQCQAETIFTTEIGQPVFLHPCLHQAAKDHQFIRSCVWI